MLGVFFFLPPRAKSLAEKTIIITSLQHTGRQSKSRGGERKMYRKKSEVIKLREEIKEKEKNRPK